MIDEAMAELALVGVKKACAALGEPRPATIAGTASPCPPRPERVPSPQPRALSEVEREEVRAVLNSDEHVDEAPASVYAKLLDEGVNLASVSTMYRVLREHGEVGDRRRYATHRPRRGGPAQSAASDRNGDGRWSRADSAVDRCGIRHDGGCVRSA